MGTRSVVAIPDGDGFKGRYVHWDGYPAWVGVQLLQIVQRDGVDSAIAVLTQDNYGWSSLDATLTADEPLGLGMNDGRFAQVPGYGTAYTTEQGQSSPDEWITSSGDDGGTEYAYVLEPEKVRVYERLWNDDGSHMTGMFGMGGGDDKASWHLLGEVSYDNPDEMEGLAR